MSGIEVKDVTSGEAPAEPSKPYATPLRKVVIVGIDMPFWEIVQMMVTLALASIPACIIIFFLGLFLSLFIGMLGGGIR